MGFLEATRAPKPYFLSGEPLYMHDWIIRNGIWGVGLLMLAQNLVPILPSEIIMPLAGFLAFMRFFKLHTVILVGLAGSLLGHLPWYFLGLSLGSTHTRKFAARFGRPAALRSLPIRGAKRWFDRNSAKAVFLGRLVPGLRTYVNIPAGTARMAFLSFLLYTVLGEALWISLLAAGGYLLGRDYRLIERYIHLIWIPVGLAVAFFLWRRRHRRRAHRHVTI